jgi:hypothetical protein
MIEREAKPGHSLGTPAPHRNDLSREPVYLSYCETACSVYFRIPRLARDESPATRQPAPTRRSAWVVSPRRRARPEPPAPRAPSPTSNVRRDSRHNRLHKTREDISIIRAPPRDATRSRRLVCCGVACVTATPPMPPCRATNVGRDRVWTKSLLEYFCALLSSKVLVYTSSHPAQV